MELEKRQIDEYLWDPEISAGKMLFLSGPRQVGKTTYARALLQAGRQGAYFNWDNPAVRRAYAADPFFFLSGRRSDREFLVIFDELHKRRRWKDILKGIYDTVERSLRILVTGSARLEWFRRSGDSLVGRYVHFHMMPISVSEAQGTPLGDLWLCGAKDRRAPFKSLVGRLEAGRGTRATYDHLFTFGGFPEPFTRASERFLRTWRRDYLTLLLREDLRDLTNIKTVDTVEQLIELLPERVGSPLSVNALAGDLEVSHATVKNHLMQLERLWLLFALRPYSKRLNRTLKKERKVYFLNWVYADGEARRFENLVASALLRATLAWTDMGIADADLWYVRGFDGGEVDFLLTLDGKPVLLVEAKLTDTDIARPTRNLAARIGVPLIQVVHRPGIFRQEAEATVVSADRLLAALP